MNTSINDYKRIIIIGNANNTVPIEEFIDTKKDFIVRFNMPNRTCPVKANCLFVANGPVVIARRTNIFNGMLENNCHIIWRYTLKDILTSKYEKISLSRKFRALLFFNTFKKKNRLNQYSSSTLNKNIQQECTNLVDNYIPSSGFLTIYFFKKNYPHIPLYIHNFTFQGWDGHNWNKEKRIISEWLHTRQIFLASSTIQNQGN